MSLRLNSVVIDTNNLELLAGFWSALLGLEVTRRENDWISLDPHLAFQLVPEQKMAKNRIHLDLVADNFAAAIGRAKELGATPVEEMREDLWQVWRDLCVLRWPGCHRDT